MLRKDIEVEIPDSKVRIKKQNRNQYVYAVLGRAGDSKDNEKDVTMEIGKVTREGFMNPNGSYFRLYPEKAKIEEIRYCYRTSNRGALIYNRDHLPMSPFVRKLYEDTV